MQDKEGKIMSKEEFLQYGSYGKEQYEGLLVASDSQQSCYNIGVQLSENKILVVDQSDETRIRERIQSWVPHIQDIQQRHGVDNDLENYTLE